MTFYSAREENEHQEESAALVNELTEWENACDALGIPNEPTALVASLIAAGWTPPDVCGDLSCREEHGNS